jgi:hypothetical protein
VGGAPRSQLAHALAMRQAGHEVVGTIASDVDILRQKAEGVRIVQAGGFDLRKPLRNVRNVLAFARKVREEKPDVIYSNRSPSYKFLCAVSDFANVPMVVGQAGGVALDQEIKPALDKVAVVYSPENVESFLAAGFKRERVHHIANRLSVPAASGPAKPDPGVLSILYTGNLKEGSIKGMIFLIDFLAEASGTIGKKFLLEFAGEPTPSGKRLEAGLRAKMEAANARLAGKGEIRHLGWVEDINLRQMSADVCVGKGRSVLQPAMAGKIGFVIGEDGVLTRITRRTIDTLAEHNFSGRGPQENSNREFLEMLGGEEAAARFRSEAMDAVAPLKVIFHIDHAAEKLTAAFEQAISSHRPSGRLRGWIRLARIYLFGIRDMLARRARV